MGTQRLICVRHGRPSADYPRRLFVTAADMNAAMDAYEVAELDRSAHRPAREPFACWRASFGPPLGYLKQRVLERDRSAINGARRGRP